MNFTVDQKIQIFKKLGHSTDSAIRRARMTCTKDEWEESKHKRAENGEFGAGGSSKKTSGMSKKSSEKIVVKSGGETNTFSSREEANEFVDAYASGRWHMSSGGKTLASGGKTKGPDDAP